jgi:hypothetical protein
MHEEKNKKQTDQQEVIALPPLKMVLVHAKDERLNKAVVQPTVKKAPVAPVSQEEQAKTQSLKKIIEHLEKEQ